MDFPESLKLPSKELWKRSEEIKRAMFPDGSYPDVVTPHKIEPGITRETTGFNLSTGEIEIYELGGGPVVDLEEIHEAKKDPRVHEIIAESIKHHTD